MGWVGPAITGATAVFSALFGGKKSGIDEETRERLLAFINANLPMFQQILSKQAGMENRLIPQVEQFWQQFMPTQFDNLSEFVRARRDRQLQALRSELDTTRQGGMRQLYQKYGNRLPASILQSFLGTVGRTGTTGRTDIARESLERQFEVGKEAAGGFMGLAGRQSGFANMFQPSLGQAMQEGLKTQPPAFTMNLGIEGLLSSLAGILKKKNKVSPVSVGGVTGGSTLAGGQTVPFAVGGTNMGWSPTFSGLGVG